MPLFIETASPRTAREAASETCRASPFLFKKPKSASKTGNRQAPVSRPRHVAVDESPPALDGRDPRWHFALPEANARQPFCSYQDA